MPAVEGFHALSSHLHHIGLWPLARLVQVGMRVVFGVYLPATTLIGKGTVLSNNGLGTVIHSGARIGANCVISSNVSIGCRSRHEGVPVIGDGCFIGTGARVLGPVRVGDGSVIGANAVVIDDVPVHSVAVGVPAKVIRTGIDVRELVEMPSDEMDF